MSHRNDVAGVVPATLHRQQPGHKAPNLYGSVEPDTFSIHCERTRPMNTTELPNCAELHATSPHKLSHQRSWFILPKGDHMPLYSPDNTSEEASLKACETWLKNRGYVESGKSFPENLTYCRRSTATSSR